MTFFYGFAVYFIIWWITLFLVLPHGVRSQAESGEEIVPGTEPGAPVHSYIWRKIFANTLLAGLVFAVWYWLTEKLGYSMEDLTNFLMGLFASQ